MESIINAYFDNDKRLCCYDGSVLYIAEDCSAYDAISAQLISLGLALCAERTEAENRYRAFSDGARVVTLCYTAYSNTVRLFVEAGDNIPIAERTASDAFAPMLTQQRLSYLRADCGMSYLIRLSDGRFVVIDGGYGDYGEEDRLYALMREQNGEQTPSIAAWFITHPHGDHFEAFRRFVERYVLDAKTARLEKVIMNFPAAALAGGFSPMAELEETLAKLAPRQIATARTGQRWTFCKTTFDILATCDDLYPAYIKNMNDASIVIRMTQKGKRTLFPGDIEHRAADQICRMYPRASLKCDILQVAHHGYWGGSEQFYTCAEPEIVLWPCPDFWYQEIRDWDCNRYFRAADNIEAICISGRADAYLTITDSGIQCEYSDAATEDYCEDFRTVKRASDLGWACVTGGDSGYAPAWLTLAPGHCKLAAGANRAVCELLSPDRFACRYPTVVTFDAEYRGEGDFGLLYNHPRPTVWAEEAFLRLDGFCSDGEVKIMLSIDPDAGIACLSVNGEERIRQAYLPAPRHGLYLALRDAEVNVRNLCVRSVHG